MAISMSQLDAQAVYEAQAERYDRAMRRFGLIGFRPESQFLIVWSGLFSPAKPELIAVSTYAVKEAVIVAAVRRIAQDSPVNVAVLRQVQPPVFVKSLEGIYQFGICIPWTGEYLTDKLSQDRPRCTVRQSFG